MLCPDEFSVCYVWPSVRSTAYFVWVTSFCSIQCPAVTRKLAHANGANFARDCVTSGHFGRMHACAHTRKHTLTHTKTHTHSHTHTLTHTHTHTQTNASSMTCCRQVQHPLHVVAASHSDFAEAAAKLLLQVCGFAGLGVWGLMLQVLGQGFRFWVWV